MKNELETLRAELHKEVDAKIDKLIKPKMDINQWYVFTTNTIAKDIIYVTKIDGYKVYFYGSNFNGDWIESDWYNTVWNYRLATPTEVQEALEKEAVKRGFKEGEKVTAILGKGKIKTTWILGKLTYRKCLSGEWIFGDGNYCIFNYGVWAEIQKTMSTLDYVKEFYETSSINLANRNELIAYIKNNNLQIIETLNNL